MGAKVAAGPSNSEVVDKQGMYWMTGKVRAMSPLRVYVVLMDVYTVEEQRGRLVH